MDYPNDERNAANGNPNEMCWFDYWLKGIDNGAMDESLPVKGYMMAGARKENTSLKNRWMYFSDWPPALRIQSWYLHHGR